MQCWGACCLPHQEGTYVTILLLQHYLYTVQPHLLYMDIIVWCTRSPVRPDGLWLCAGLGDACLTYKVQVLYKCDSCCLSEWHDMTWHDMTLPADCLSSCRFFIICQLLCVCGLHIWSLHIPWQACICKEMIHRHFTYMLVSTLWQSLLSGNE